MQMNNISGRAAHLRDTFLGCEQEYLKSLRKNPRFYKTVEKLNHDYNSDKLYCMAVKSIQKIELGQVEPKQLESEEFFILASLSAIVDYEKVLEKVRVPEDYGRGR